MRALELYAGPAALRHLHSQGLQPRDVRVVPGAAGGPKGLILGPLDRFLFGDWLAQSDSPVDLVGASIGAWRMATACLADPISAFRRLEHDYIHQDYRLEPGQKRPTPHAVSEQFGQSLKGFFEGEVSSILAHPRYRLHIVTSRGRHVLGREHRVATPLGYLGAFLTNSVNRKAMGAWLERVVFSTHDAALPFAATDFRTRQVALTEANFSDALQASCSIPFVLKSVHNIAGAPPGAYWDGGITDYHLHLNYAAAAAPASSGLVLYPHFQKAVVPGWLDKGLKWRHRSSHFLDNMLLLAPSPAWVQTLPNGKLPDRNDFLRYGNDLQGRVTAWSAAASASQQLADEFADWLDKPDLSRVGAL
ncbi:MAG: phospholipase [Pseudomonadota bacterium]